MKYACKKHGLNHDNCSEKSKKKDEDGTSLDFMTCYNNGGDGFENGSMKMGEMNKTNSEASTIYIDS